MEGQKTMKKLKFLTALLLTTLWSAQTLAIEEDKAAHFFVNTIGTFGISMGMHAMTGFESKTFSLITGAGAMTTVSFAKEIMDMQNSRYRQTGLDWGDMAANFAGIAAGGVLFLVIAPDKEDFNKTRIYPQVFPTRNGPAPGVGASVSMETIENLFK